MAVGVQWIARREWDNGGDSVDYGLCDLGARLRIRQHLESGHDENGGQQRAAGRASELHQSTVLGGAGRWQPAR